MPNSWEPSLHRSLTSSRKPAILGVGQELRGDDAVGPMVVQALLQSESFSAGGNEKRKPLLLDAGPLPENFTAILRREKPDTVVFVDAAEMGLPCGTIAWLDPHQVGSFSSGTHALPLRSVSEFLEKEIGCRVFILGVQPGNLAFDAPISAEVQEAICEIITVLKTVL